MTASEYVMALSLVEELMLKSLRMERTMFSGTWFLSPETTLSLGNAGLTSNILIPLDLYVRYGEYLDMAQTVWDTDYTDTHVLVTSCTNVTIDTRSRNIIAKDCINGSVFPWDKLPSVTNLTNLQGIMDSQGYQKKLDPTNTTFPFDVDILIIKRTELKVNHEGCVNTLKEECKYWIGNHSRDGKNYTAKARYTTRYFSNISLHYTY